MKALLRMTAVLAVACAACLAAYGQSNDRIDELLGQPQARLDSTAYIIMAASGAINEEDGVDQALAKLAELGCVAPGAAPEARVSVQDLSFYLMKALALPGGVMYSLLPSPWYAFREMDFNKLVDGSGGRLRPVSGAEVMRCLGQALAFKKGGAQ